MTDSKWEITKDTNGRSVYSWKDYQVTYQVIAASYLTRNRNPVWGWVAKRDGMVIKLGGDPEELMNFCQEDSL